MQNWCRVGSLASTGLHPGNKRRRQHSHTPVSRISHAVEMSPVQTASISSRSRCFIAPLPRGHSGKLVAARFLPGSRPALLTPKNMFGENEESRKVRLTRQRGW